MNRTKKLVHTVRLLGASRFLRLGFDALLHHDPIRPWKSDPEFSALFARCEPHTLVDPVRAYMLHQLVRQAAQLPGHVAEVGVYRGGTALLLAEGLRDSGKRLYLFDTFSGMPKTGARDFVREGDFSDVSIEAVRALLAEYEFVSIHPGLFPSTAEAVGSEVFSLAHIDVDMHDSVLSCCDFFYRRMVPGGFMVFDDYGFLACRSAKVAVDAFFADRRETPIYLPTGQCIATKLAGD